MNDLIIMLHLKLAIIRICITISLRRIPKQRTSMSVSDPPTQEFLYIKKEVDYSTSFSLWCGAGSNRRHKDFQSFALPTELPHLFLPVLCLFVLKTRLFGSFSVKRDCKDTCLGIIFQQGCY